MAKNTPNYEFEKPKQNDFYDVDVQNRNWDKAETALTEFDDSGSVDEIKSFPDFLKKFVTGNKLAVTMRNLKAGMQFVLHAGQIVNNCVTDNAGLPLSAAQGKALMDKYTQLYSDMKNIAMDGYCINPDTTTTFLAILNGWNDRKENIPSFVNNAMYILITVWVFPNTDDKLGSERIQAVFGGKNFAFRTFSPNKKVWSKWEENT